MFLAALIALSHPDPVTSLGVARHPDGTVSLSWTLPPDPSIVGVTIFRYRLRDGDLVIFEIIGLTSGYDDTSARASQSYDYWVHTRGASGFESIGVVVTSFALVDDHHTHVDCYASVSAPGDGLPFGVAGIILAATLLPRRRLSRRVRRSG